MNNATQHLQSAIKFRDEAKKLKTDDPADLKVLQAVNDAFNYFMSYCDSNPGFANGLQRDKQKIAVFWTEFLRQAQMESTDYPVPHGTLANFGMKDQVAWVYSTEQARAPKVPVRPATPKEKAEFQQILANG